MIKLLHKLDLRALGRFFAGGVVSVGVTLAVTALLHEFAAVPERIAAAIGLVTALVVNFAVLRFFAFRGTGVPLGRQLPMFLASSGVFRGLEYGGFFVLHWLGVHYLLALVMVLGVSFIVKFLVYDKLVFARERAHGQSKTPQP
jgi:putative flippase GtrA